jgi:hypothetical protein
MVSHLAPFQHTFVQRALRETFHLIGLALLLGSILVVNLTVMGFGVRRPAERLAGNSRRGRWEGSED